MQIPRTCISKPTPTKLSQTKCINGKLIDLSSIARICPSLASCRTLIGSKIMHDLPWFLSCATRKLTENSADATRCSSASNSARRPWQNLWKLGFFRIDFILRESNMTLLTLRVDHCETMQAKKRETNVLPLIFSASIKVWQPGKTILVDFPPPHVLEKKFRSNESVSKLSTSYVHGTCCWRKLGDSGIQRLTNKALKNGTKPPTVGVMSIKLCPLVGNQLYGSSEKLNHFVWSGLFQASSQHIFFFWWFHDFMLAYSDGCLNILVGARC